MTEGERSKLEQVIGGSITMRVVMVGLIVCMMGKWIRTRIGKGWSIPSSNVYGRSHLQYSDGDEEDDLEKDNLKWPISHHTSLMILSSSHTHLSY